MKWKVLFIAALLEALAWMRRSHAEEVKTNQSTKLLSRAGEQSRVILKLGAGQSMTVLDRDGRWIKVRVSGRTGWIPRSKVGPPDGDGSGGESGDETIVRNTRRRPFVDGRSTRRGFSGDSGPDDRIGADATEDGEGAAEDGEAGGDAAAGEAVRPIAHVANTTTIYNDPDRRSGTAFTAQPSTALYAGEQHGQWTFVENDEGDAGFVLTSKLEDAAPAGGGPRTRSIDLRGRLGVSRVRRSIATPGGPAAVPDNYTARGPSATVALGVSVLYPLQRRSWLGGEIAYDLDRRLLIGGIEDKRTRPKTLIRFAHHDLDLRAVGGYELENGMIALVRLGFHHGSFQVPNVADFTRNTFKLPNQIIQGPTIGGALVVPRLTTGVGIEVNLDVMPIGVSVEQTRNLEDGTGPGARAISLGGTVAYRWKPRMDLLATFDLANTWVSFAGAAPASSMRGHAGASPSSGSDRRYGLSVGIAYAL